MGKHSLAAQAITDVRVRIVKKQTLSALVLSDCKVADRLLSLTARELARKQSLALLLSRAAHERIEWSHDSPSGHQAKADRAPRFRQCLIIAPRSSTCRVQLHWRLGQGADHSARRASRRPGTGQQRRARRRGVQSRAQAYVFNVFGWLAEAARD
jgi:hypothetical protein